MYSYYNHILLTKIFIELRENRDESLYCKGNKYYSLD